VYLTLTILTNYQNIFLKELRHFFEEYSKLESNEVVKVAEILSAESAYQIINDAIADYASGRWQK
jgi:inorganic pyrophosphatase